MEKQKNMQTIIIFALVAVILTMSVGFAAFSQELSIAGNVNVASSSWKIQFDEESYKEAEGSVAATTTNLQGTAMEYIVSLEKPGDFYEFTVDVNNLGTFDANLTGITMSSNITAAQSEFVSYEVYYGNTKFTESNDELSIPIAAKTGKETVRVKIAYILPEDPTNLPADPVKLTLAAALMFEQAE